MTYYLIGLFVKNNRYNTILYIISILPIWKTYPSVWPRYRSFLFCPALVCRTRPTQYVCIYWNSEDTTARRIACTSSKLQKHFLPENETYTIIKISVNIYIYIYSVLPNIRATQSYYLSGIKNRAVCSYNARLNARARVTYRIKRRYFFYFLN